nr:hypothetical protein BgiMline_025495 [Biomphalaria glabrata]
MYEQTIWRMESGFVTTTAYHVVRSGSGRSEVDLDSKDCRKVNSEWNKNVFIEPASRDPRLLSSAPPQGYICYNFRMVVLPTRQRRSSTYSDQDVYGLMKFITRSVRLRDSQDETDRLVSYLRDSEKLHHKVGSTRPGQWILFGDGLIQFYAMKYGHVNLLQMGGKSEQK